MINPFKKTYSPEEIGLFNFLSQINIFELLSYEELNLFKPYLYLRQYKEEEAVFFRADPSHAYYIVKSGRVSLNIDIRDKFEVLNVMKPGSGFGDNVLLENTKRIYSAVVTSEQAQLYVLPQVNIHEIFNEHVHVKAKMLASLAELYNGYTENLFKAYKSSVGFFNLGQAYLNSEITNDNNW